MHQGGKKEEHMNDPNNWLIPGLLFALGGALLVVGIVIGFVTHRRERQRMAPYLRVPDHGVMTTLDLEEVRRRAPRREDVGGDDAA